MQVAMKSIPLTALVCLLVLILIGCNSHSEEASQKNTKTQTQQSGQTQRANNQEIGSKVSSAEDGGPEGSGKSSSNSVANEARHGNASSQSKDSYGNNKNSDDPVRFETPSLENILIQDFGPIGNEKNAYGAIVFKDNLPGLIFDEFGRKDLHNPSAGSLNTSFKFRAPLETILVAPISGSITYIEWQPNKNHSSGDWEIHISADTSSPWMVIIDHLVSLECGRSSSTVVPCESDLNILGNPIDIGAKIEAGQPIGYIGNWLYDNDGPTYGHTELSILKYSEDRNSASVYCPIPYIQPSKQEYYVDAVADLMKFYEQWAGDGTVYLEDQMPYPGCLYEKIDLNPNGTTVVENLQG